MLSIIGTLIGFGTSIVPEVLGYFKQQLQVYSREGERCFICTKIIKMINYSGRATFYCETCQKSPKAYLKEI